jgi:ferredoxin
MAYKITQECIGCGTCERECPSHAIRQGPNRYEIDSSLCTECIATGHKPQCLRVCPVGASQPDPTHKETAEQLRAKTGKKK